MWRLLRWTTYLLALLFLLSLAAFGVALALKPRILAAVNEELKKNINGEVQIGGLDFTIFEEFPVLSVTLSDIYIRGPRYAQYSREFLSAGKIFVHVKPFRLLKGEINLRSITLRDARISIFRTADGYTNLDSFNKKDTAVVKDTSGSSRLISLAVEKVKFENTRVTYFDSAKRKSYAANFVRTSVLIGQTDTSRVLSLDGPMVFEGLMFNEVKGSYLDGKEVNAALNVEFVPALRRLIVRPSTLAFRESVVQVSGFFNFAQPGTFNLAIHSDSLDYNEALTIVTDSLAVKLKKFSLDQPVQLDVLVDGLLAGGAKPKVDIRFASANNHVAAGKVEVKEFTFAGTFTNHLDSSQVFDDLNSRVELNSFSGSVKGIPVKGNLILSNLKDPTLDITSQTSIQLTDLNAETDPEKINFLSGNLSVYFSYNGKLSEYLDDTRTSFEGKLNGNVNLENAAWSVVSKEKEFRETNVNIRFNEKQMDIDKATTNVNGNVIEMTGKVTGFIPFFFQPSKKGKVMLNIHSKRVDLATLRKKKTQPGVRRAGNKGKKRISDLVDALYAKVEFDVELSVDQLVNGPMKASGVSAKLRLADERFSADPLKMKLAGGDIGARLVLTNLDKPNNSVSFRGTVKGADISKLFESFNNFSQKNITSRHLSGNISMRIDMNCIVDDRFNILSPSIRGDVDLRIKEGRIQDFEPLEKMSNVLFKKRDFTDVQFAEIRSRFQMEGKSFNVERMEVESSVLTLFIEGKYSLASETDLSIQVPLSNLKKRNKDYKPENVGVDSKVGPSVFLRARHKDGALVIGYDPLKKFKKSK